MTPRPAPPLFMPEPAFFPPGAPRSRVLLFALLGYLYIAAMVAGMVLLAVLVVRLGMGALIFFPLGVLITLLFSLAVAIARPQGRRVTREEAPRLFRAIDRARGQLRAPEVDVVLLGTDLNAWVLELPRVGVFGPRVRYLTVGMPLLHALTEDEVRAVLAHEFAHLSRQHNRVHLWLVRGAATWNSMAAGLQATRNWGRFLVLPFFRWYAPRLELLTLAASRAHEYESDRLAGRAVGPELHARALMRLEVSAHRLEREVVRTVLRASGESESPPAEAFAQLLRGLDARPDPATQQAALAAVLRNRSMDAHSHPSLCERVASLGVAVDAAGAAAMLAGGAPRAVNALLDADFRDAVEAELGTAWNASVQKVWKRCHADACVWRQAGVKDDGADADLPALLARARWAVSCESDDSAVPLLRRVLERDPGHTEASVMLGHLLLDAEDGAAQQAGVALLEREAARPSIHAVAAVAALREHHARAGDAAALARMRARELALRDEQMRRIRERSELSHADTLRPYALPPAAHQALLRALREHPVERAFLVQKQTRWLADSAVVVLAVQVQAPWFRSSAARSTRVCRALLSHLHLPETLDSLLTAVEPRTALMRRLSEIPGAEVYRAGHAAPEPAALPGEWSRPRGMQRLSWLRPGFAGAVAAVVLGLFALVSFLDRPDDDVDRLARLRREVGEHPDDPRANERLAWELVRLDHYPEADSALVRAIRQQPRDADLHSALGWVRMQKTEFHAAVAPLRRAVELQPRHPQAYAYLGWTLYRLDRLEESEQAYRAAVRIRPDAPELRGELGSVLLDLYRPAEAEEEFTRALRRDSTQAGLFRGLARAQMQRGWLGDATVTLRRALALDPENPGLWADMGHLAHLSARYVESDSAFRRAHALDSTYFDRNPYRRGMWEASRAGRPYRPTEPGP